VSRVDELSDALDDAALSDPGVSRDRQVGFFFSGTGGQWWAMGRELNVEETAFRRALGA
jgi:acyl transferase domain-containing protein